MVSESVWQNTEILKRFSRYRGIIDGMQTPRYLIAKTIACDFDSSDSIESIHVKEENNLMKLEDVNMVSKELEVRLKSYLDADYLSLVSNGTLGLQIALKALDLKGEIITTPFTFVATLEVYNQTIFLPSAFTNALIVY